MGGSRGGTWGTDPSGYTIIGFLRNTGRKTGFLVKCIGSYL